MKKLLYYIVGCFKATFNKKDSLFYICDDYNRWSEFPKVRAVPTYRFYKFMGIVILGKLNDPVIKSDLQYSDEYEGIEKDAGKLVRLVSKDNFIVV